MISEKVYHEQMQRLEGLMNYKISDLSFKSWKEALEEDGFNDHHLTAGISKIKDWLQDFEKKLRPQDINYGTLARACGNIRRDYTLYESDQERTKRVSRDNEEAKRLFHDKNYGHQISPYGRKCLELIQALCAGEIGIEEYKQRHFRPSPQDKIRAHGD